MSDVEPTTSSLEPVAEPQALALDTVVYDRVQCSRPPEAAVTLIESADDGS